MGNECRPLIVRVKVNPENRPLSDFAANRNRESEDRAGGIRTHDLLNPIQAHYQAVLRPDLLRIIH